MQNAEIYMTKAAKTPGAPVIVGLLAARLINREGKRDTVTAIEMLKAMYLQAGEENYKENLRTRNA